MDTYIFIIYSILMLIATSLLIDLKNKVEKMNMSMRYYHEATINKICESIILQYEYKKIFEKIDSANIDINKKLIAIEKKFEPRLTEEEIVRANASLKYC